MSRVLPFRSLRSHGPTFASCLLSPEETGGMDSGPSTGNETSLRALLLLVGMLLAIALPGSLAFAGPINLGGNENRSRAAGLEGRTGLNATRTGQIMLLPDTAYHEILLHRIREAEHRIDISMFLFKITGAAQNRPASIMRELIAARTRGVGVRVLLERSGHDGDLSRENRKVAELLQKAGITVEFADPRRTNHTKLVVIDGRYSFVGSHNLTHAALAYNHELSLLIDNDELASELINYIAGLTRDQ